MGPGSNLNSNANSKGNVQGYGQDGSSSSGSGSRGIVRGGVHELEPGWKPVELGTSEEIAEKDSGV